MENYFGMLLIAVAIFLGLLKVAEAIKEKK
jgi:hypothetical protein